MSYYIFMILKMPYILSLNTDVSEICCQCKGKNYNSIFEDWLIYISRGSYDWHENVFPNGYLFPVFIEAAYCHSIL